MGSARPYRMGARAAAAEQTGDRIVAAALALYQELWLDEITLDKVASRAEVSTKTLLRRYGSRDGLLGSVAATVSAAVAEQRFEARVGDVDDAVRNLIAHYERRGRMALRNIVQAERSPWIASLVDAARAEHHRWVAEVFAPQLAQRDRRPGDLLRAQLITVTDLATWNVLRNDLDLSTAQTERAIRGLVTSLIGKEVQP
jgi:AcrR family transcriptional regulator